MGRGRGLRGSERGERAALLTGDVNESSRGPRGKVAAWVVTGAVVAAAIVGTVVTLAVVRDGNNGTPSPNQHQRGYRSAAVATDAEVCSDMGVDVLKAGGGAVDAAIASLLCIGVVNSHSSGIGGGGFMVVYNGSAVETIDFREMAPQAATELMFANFTDCKPDAGGQGDATRCPSRLGGLAVGVPGELRGLEVAHRRHGKLPWRDVLAPVIALCRNGFLVTGTNAAAIRSSLEFIQDDPILNETFLRNGEPYTEGQRMRRPRLADTLELVAERGADAIYKGAIAERIVQLVETNVFRPGILTLADLENYRPVVRDATVTTYHGLQLFSAPPPASGAVLSLILNILELYNFSCAEGRTLLADHRIVEAMKFGYGHRTLLGDPCCGEEPGTCVNATLCTAVSAEANDMVSKQLAEALQEKISDTSTNHTPSFYGGEFDVQDTPGTTHLSVVGPGGDAASVTSTINTYFGSKIMTEDGIILNNEMDDFSTPGFTNAFGFEPSPINFIRPYRRPLSSSAPVIVLDDDGVVQFVAGASGGARITTAVAQVALNVLSFCDSVRDAVDKSRIHHQLLPVWIFGESDYPDERVVELERIGHYWNYTSSNGVCQAIARGTVGPKDADPNLLYAASDSKRKSGAIASGY